MLRKAALLVGIDDYHSRPLDGCVNDARAMATLLSRNEDGSPNFKCATFVAPRTACPSPAPTVTRGALRDQVHEIFAKQVDVALFYFSGHGTVTPRGGVLVTQDATRGDEGITMAEIVDAANQSDIGQIAIIVDTCFSGRLGTAPAIRDGHALLNEGLSILAASSLDETAMERAGRGVFTSLVCGALEGGASDVMGEVTLAGVYSYAEQALGPFDQRPMFKSNVSRMLPLRVCRPVVMADILRKLTDYFPSVGAEYPLDPAYEPDHKQHPPGTLPDPEKERIFGDLQKLRAARLIVPVGEEHMFYAAIHHKSCRLTPLGQFYWRRAKEDLL
jgi:Caspase domain